MASLRKALSATPAISSPTQIAYQVSQAAPALFSPEIKFAETQKANYLKSLKQLVEKVSEMTKTLNEIKEIAGGNGSVRMSEMFKEGKDIVKKRVQEVYETVFLPPHEEKQDSFLREVALERPGEFQIVAEDYLMEKENASDFLDAALEEKLKTELNSLRQAAQRLTRFLVVLGVGIPRAHGSATIYPVEKGVHVKVEKISNLVESLFPADERHYMLPIQRV